MSVLVAFSVTPLGVGEGVGEIVTEAIRVVRDSRLTTMRARWGPACRTRQMPCSP